MSPRTGLSILLLLAVPASADVTTRPAVVGDDAAALVVRLADTNSTVRREAFRRLERLGPRADAALRAGLRDPRPAVVDAAAELIVRSGRWYDDADPSSVRLVLMGYGRSDPTARANVLSEMLIGAALPDYRRVVLRTLARDPSPSVAWLTLGEVAGDAEWEKAILAIDPDDRPPTLPTATLMLRAKAREAANDPEAAAGLARRVLDTERRRPTASGEVLSWAFEKVVAADVEARAYADAAARLRDQTARTDDDGVRGTVVDRLLDLQIRHGPLPGLAGDLHDADDSADDHSTTAVALMAERAGLPMLGGALLGAALRERPDEIASDRAARLGEAADILQRAGYGDAACRVYESVVTTDTEQARGRITLAYAQLSDLHLAAGRPALAAYCLQQAIDRQDGPIARTRAGRSEMWTIDDQQACVYWYYLLDARYRRDDVAVRRFARAVLETGSTEGGMFLDVAPDLPAVATAAQVDAYFDRCFERARTRLLEAPDDPVYANDIAWLCARSGRRLDEAFAWAKHASEKLPVEAAYLDTFAEVNFRTGRVKQAIELETPALALQPEDDVFMAGQLGPASVPRATPPGN